MMQKLLLRNTYPTLQTGDVFDSPGKSFQYEVIGAVCPLFDRDNLPHPHCSLQWRGKAPSWRRIDSKDGVVGVGRRFIPDISAKGLECYNVRLLWNGSRPTNGVVWVFTYWETDKELRDWWWFNNKLK